MAVLEDLDEGEAYLYAILMDPSGLDQAEFMIQDHETPDRQGLWRAWPFQWKWFRCVDPLQIDCAGRAIGKSQSIKFRSLAFPFVHTGQEMVVAAPELNHLTAITQLVEQMFKSGPRILREMLPKGKNQGITHRPFMIEFLNGCRILGRIPQKSGVGVKGSHPLWLEQDECFPAGTLVLSSVGWVPIEQIVVGDEVLTHKGRWRRVTQTMERGEREAVVLKGQGHPGLTSTPNHKFYAQRAKRHQSGGQGWEWVSAAEMEGCYWAAPLKVEALVVPAIPLAVTNKKRDIVPTDPALLHLLGWWLAEGSCSSQVGGGALNRVWWSVTPDEAVLICRLVDQLGLKAAVNPLKSSDKCVNVVVHHSPLARWLVGQCGKGARHKQIPPWVYGLDSASRRLVLDGIIDGDGYRDATGLWKVSTASKALAVGLRILAQMEGYHVSLYWNDLSDRHINIRGRAVRSPGFFQVVGRLNGQGLDDDTGVHRLTKVRSVVPAEATAMYDLEVEDDHSFVVEGVVAHNSQDFTHEAWMEIIETLKRGVPGAIWRAHGVTKGVRDDFYKNTQPGSGWKVHHYTALHRPTWTDQERQEKIELYGSRHAPDYKRNIMGQHGDASSPLFVASRLMGACDTNEQSDYNAEEYRHIRITTEALEDVQGQVSFFLDFPGSHKQYATTWAGADIGWTASPSEFLIFGESTPVKGKPSVLKLLTRIHMERLDALAQAQVAIAVMEFYRCRVFAMDATGAGLPLFQVIQAQCPSILGRIRGYGFAEKRVVELDSSKPIDEFRGDPMKEAGIERNLLDYSSDKIRELVDQKRIQLPWDRDLIGEFQGQTWTANRSATTDASGRPSRVFSKGKVHTLDAAKMMVLGFVMAPLEEFLEGYMNRPAVMDVVIGGYPALNEIPVLTTEPVGGRGYGGVVVF